MEASRGTPRSIRLKEFSPGLVRPTQPEPEYIAKTDGTLSLGRTVLRGDNNGFLMTGNDLSGDRKKIIILGDSFVESYWASAETARWVSVAERCMEQQFPGQFALKNAGYSGATSLHMAMQLPSKMRALFKDIAGIVLFVPTNNDAVTYSLKHTYWTKNRYWSPLEPIDHSGDLPENGFDADQDTKANWSMMFHYLQLYKVPTLLFVPPYRNGVWGEEPFLTSVHRSAEDFAAWKKSRNRVIELALESAKEFEVPIIDARSYMADTSGNATFFYDQLHLNDKGHQLFGHLFSQELAKSKFWVPQVASTSTREEYTAPNLRSDEKQRTQKYLDEDYLTIEISVNR